MVSVTDAFRQVGSHTQLGLNFVQCSSYHRMQVLPHFFPLRLRKLRRYQHATVPFVFRRQVSWLTLETSSEFHILIASVIDYHVTWLSSSEPIPLTT